jgi:hypothetical protein
MVFIATILIIGLPIMAVIANLAAFAFWILSPIFVRIENRLLRFLARVGFLAISVTVSIPISIAVQPLLPDFRTAGDGGVGMAHNALSVATLYAATPCAIMLASAYSLSLRMGKPTPGGLAQNTLPTRR